MSYKYKQLNGAAFVKTILRSSGRVKAIENLLVFFVLETTQDKNVSRYLLYVS
jgi:hypothetical protein